MLEVKAGQFPNETSLIKEEVKQLKSLYFLALVDTKQRMKDALFLNLGSWIVEPEALSAYPFLKDLPRMINDYIDCFDVIQTNDYISLVIDREKLVDKGLPENLSTIIEYGDEAIPPFSHIRSVLQTVQPMYKQVLEGLKKA